MLDWRQYCRGVEWIRLRGLDLMVAIEGGRKQNIFIRETEEVYEMSGIVARPKAMEEIEELGLRALQRNRTTSLVGFRIDKKNRLVGESWVPKVGLTKEEFLIYLKRLACECDLFEYQLTGEDRE